MSNSEPARPQLGLFDAVSIIIGIVVGVAIFKTPAMVFGNLYNPSELYAAWILGGVLSFAGALCYAELGTAYPRSGGDYVYLTRAFGRPVGFLFGWAQLTVILTGSIAAMAYAFADYAMPLFVEEPQKHPELAVTLAVVPVVLLTAMNLFGVVFGKAAQNVLTVAKILGVGGIIVVGLLWGAGDAVFRANPITQAGVSAASLAVLGPEGLATAVKDASTASAAASFGLAMVFVLYAFGGWNDAAFVAAEVKNQRRNLPAALLLGTGLITVLYVLVNTAYLWALGYDGVRGSFTPAADVFEIAFGTFGSKAMSLVVMVSALGAVNGLIFTGSRIYSSLGADHRLFAALGKWHPRFRTPIWSLVVQAAIAVLLILAVGTQTGRDLIDDCLRLFRIDGMPWAKYFGGFDTLVTGTAAVFWMFFLMTGVSQFVLRIKDPNIERPFRTPLFPLPALAFCGMCAYMLYSALDYAKWLSLLGIVPLVIGLPMYVLSGRGQK